MKKSYQISILGQELSVLSDSGDEHVADVFRYVNDKVDEISKVSSNVNTLNIAVLTALNIADEYLKFTGINRKICNQLESRAESLISLIDDVK